jgi:hypothetical protein
MQVPLLDSVVECECAAEPGTSAKLAMHAEYSILYVDALRLPAQLAC